MLRDAMKVPPDGTVAGQVSVAWALCARAVDAERQIAAIKAQSASRNVMRPRPTPRSHIIVRIGSDIDRTPSRSSHLHPGRTGQHSSGVEDRRVPLRPATK